MKRLLTLGFGALACVALLATGPSPVKAAICDAGCSLQVTPVVPGLTSIDGFFQTSGNGVLNISGNVSGTAMGSAYSENGAISGLVGTSAGGSFVPPSSSSGNYFTFSNTFNGTTFDGNGLLFAFDTGNYGNIYESGGLTYLSLWLPDGNAAGANFIPGERVNLSVAAVPLPGTLPLFGSGLAGLGVLGWRRKRKQAKSAVPMLAAG